MSAAKLVSSEHRFDPPTDADPVAVSRPGRLGWTIAYIYPGDAQLRVVVHVSGIAATLTGSQLHEATGRPIRTTTLSKTWTPDGAAGNDELADAPEWVRDAVAEVTR